MHTQGEMVVKGKVTEWKQIIDNKVRENVEWIGGLWIEGKTEVAHVQTYTTDDDYGINPEEGRANSERLAALWNAAEGLSLEDAVSRLKGE